LNKEKGTKQGKALLPMWSQITIKKRNKAERKISLRSNDIKMTGKENRLSENICQLHSKGYVNSNFINGS